MRLELQQSGRWRRGWVIGLTVALLLLLLGALIYAGTLQLRGKVRGQITRRDGEILKAVALMQQINGETSDGLGGEIESFADQFNLAMQVSQLHQGIIGTRLYGTNGGFQGAFPAYVVAASLPPSDLKELQALRPVSRFHSDLPLQAVIGEHALPQARAPMLEVEVPLYRQAEGRLLGVVQFVIDGADIQAEFAALDRHLAWQAAIAFAAGTVLMATTLIWAFGRLEKSARLLMERTARLQQANEKLVLAAKTSAVGSVTAHLVHGLSSPLAGLKDFLAARAEGNVQEWEAVAETTRRMESLVRDLVSFLGQEQSPHYEITLAELLQSLRARQDPSARSRKVCLKMSQEIDAILDNRQANLVLLILDQIVENAVQITPAGHTVEVRIVDGADRGILVTIADQGPGFPAHLQGRLFTPCRSTKPDGHGLGLAIAKNLADHLGAVLSLGRNSPAGCTFELLLPLAIYKSRLASPALSG